MAAGTPNEDPVPDSAVARAFDRVLDTERAVREAVAQCERECNAALEAARERARHILERAQRRSIALHARCTAMTERRAAEEAEMRAEAEAHARAGHLDSAQFERAIVRLAASLTTRSAEPADDGP